MTGIRRRTVAGALLLAVLAGCARPEAPIEGLADAEHARIGVMTGSTGETIVRKRFPAADVQSFDDIMDAVAAINAGQLDAAVTAYPQALQVTRKNAGLRLLEEPLDNEPTAVAMRREDAGLLAQVNAAIAGLKADGTLADMRRRWLKPDLGPYEELSIEPAARGTVLRVGVSATREPFSFVDANGRVTGHDGELARLLGARLGRPIEFFDMKFMALIPALQSGKIDVIVTGMTATEERRRQVAFSDPYFDNAQMMVVRRAAGATPAAGTGAAPPLGTIDDLRTRRIGVLLGSAHDTYVARTFPDAVTLQYRTPADLVLAVRVGKVDAAFFDADPLRPILQADPSLGYLGGTAFSFDCGVGFAKADAGLRQQFDRFLAEIRGNGVYADMVRRWMTEGSTAMPPLPDASTGGDLVVGVSDVGLPFVAVQDNELVGFDIELVRRFAASLGRRAVLGNMEFGGLVSSVASGKVDLIASSIYITDERRQQIDFSAPYYRMDTRVVGLRRNIAAYAGPGSRTSVPDATGGSFATRLAQSFRSNILLEQRYLLIWEGLKTTVVISIAATLVGTLLGALVCLLRMSDRRILALPARVYIAVLRGTPVLVVLMLVFYVVFASVDISPVLVAVIAFGMNFAAYSAEIFRAGIEGVDRGQTEAGLALGFTRLATFWYVVLPQTIQRILPVYKGEFISLVKMTSIVGYIAVQDLTKAGDIIRARTFDAFFPLVMVALLYFTISWVLLQALDRVERATDPKYRRQRRGRA